MTPSPSSGPHSSEPCTASWQRPSPWGIGSVEWGVPLGCLGLIPSSGSCEIGPGHEGCATFRRPHQKCPVVKQCSVLSGGAPATTVAGALLKGCVRRFPTLPHAGACSTIGARRLNFRVRYGTGCFPSAMTTATVFNTQSSFCCTRSTRCSGGVDRLWQPPCPPSDCGGGGCCVCVPGTTQWTRTRCMPDHLVHHPLYCWCPAGGHKGGWWLWWQASRPLGIGQLHTSRRFHVRPINPVVYRGPYQHKDWGTLILKRASHLDAFSGYHFPT